MGRLQHKVTSSLKQSLEKLKLSENAAETKGARIHLSSSFHVTVVSGTIHFFCLCSREGHVDSES